MKEENEQSTHQHQIKEKEVEEKKQRKTKKKKVAPSTGIRGSNRCTERASDPGKA